MITHSTLMISHKKAYKSKLLIQANIQLFHKIFPHVGEKVKIPKSDNFCFLIFQKLRKLNKLK